MYHKICKSRKFFCIIHIKCNSLFTDSLYWERVFSLSPSFLRLTTEFLYSSTSLVLRSSSLLNSVFFSAALIWKRVSRMFFSEALSFHTYSSISASVFFFSHSSVFWKDKKNNIWFWELFGQPCMFTLIHLPYPAQLPTCSNSCGLHTLITWIPRYHSPILSTEFILYLPYKWHLQSKTISQKTQKTHSLQLSRRWTLTPQTFLRLKLWELKGDCIYLCKCLWGWQGEDQLL